MTDVDALYPANAKTRLAWSFLMGLLTGLAVGLFSKGELAPLVGWDTAALFYVAWVWLSVLPMDAHETKRMALREAPSRTFSDILLIGASLASLIAVGFLIAEAGHASGLLKGVEIFLGLFSVIVSWIAVQTTYALKYASLYYDGTEGGIDFNDASPPKYADFAYLAFTLGMTFQVSDTAIKTKEIRATALKHSLLSYVFGTVIIATTINTIASLGK